jgi:mycobactin polyketide synthetase MbtD
LSAHAEDLVSRDARAVSDYLDRHPGVTVAAVAGHLTATRRLRRHRAVIRAADRAELADGLRAVADGAEHPLVTRSAEGAAVRTAFVFPGQGTQWPSMGAEAYRLLPAYRAQADACAAAFLAAGAPSPLRYLTTSAAPETFTETEIEGAQFVHAVALAAVWRAHGVLPDLTVGHSLGEIGAAYVAGAVTLADAVAVVIARAGVVDRLPGRYAVAVLGLDADAAQRVIAETTGWLELSVVNAPSSVAVSGDRAAVRAAVATVRGRGGFAREITVGFPVHTSILEPLRDDLVHRLPQSVFAATPVQFIGGATGEIVSAGTGFGDYWYGNLRNVVRFDRAVTTAVRCGARIFVELSAHPSLLFALGDLLGDAAAALVGTGRRDQPLTDTLSAQLATVAVADPHHDWRAGVTPVALQDFPNAPMRATPMWAEAEPLPEVATVTVSDEQWQPVAPPPPAATPRRVAVRDLGPAGPLGALVRAAVDRHPGVVSVPDDEADVTVVVAPPPAGTDVDSAVSQLVALVGDGVLHYPRALGSRCREVWLVTAGAEQVRSGEAQALSAAALAAMHRSLGREHPDLAFHHLDLPENTASADPVADALLTTGGELAVRITEAGAALYRRGWREAPAAAALPAAGGLLEDVVITGGAGAIGAHYARHLAERGAGRIVLLSRRDVTGDALAALSGRGADVRSVPCDITDRDSLAAAAARYAGDGASLVIHAAGAATFARGDRLDADAADHSLAAKVTGLARMTEVWPLRSDARILLCSSVSGLWGGHGHAAYAAANRMLDVMAGRLRAEGRPCVSVRWGLWQAGEGATGIVDAAETARIERSGLRPMPPSPAIEASLRDHAADPLVFSADEHRLRLFLESATPPAAAGTPAEPPADTAGVVRAELAAVLDLPGPGAVDLGSSLFDLGVDSLLALDLRKRFQRGIGRTVPLATLLGGITGTELVDQLDQKVTTPK